MRELDEKITAFHEAGHAVVDLTFGHKIERVSIVREGDAAGLVIIDRPEDDALRYEDELQRQVLFERKIMACLAGVIAQERFAPGSVKKIHRKTDLILANEYLLELLDAPTQEMKNAYLRLLRLKTAALLDILWPRVESLANALLERKTLTASELQEF